MRLKDITPKRIIKENEELISKLEDKKSSLEIALSNARAETKNIKYADMHMEIVNAVSNIAEEHGIAMDEFNIDQVFRAKYKLDSAIYQLEEDFEEAIRDISNKIDELEYGED